jgi:hypothetical protein
MVVSIGTIKTLKIVKTNYFILLLFAALSSLSIQCKEDEKVTTLTPTGTEFVAIYYKGIDYHSEFSVNKGQKLYLNITRLDSINRIISGNFRISLLDYTGTKAMHLEYGRFDSYY